MCESLLNPSSLFSFSCSQCQLRLLRYPFVYSPQIPHKPFDLILTSLGVDRMFHFFLESVILCNTAIFLYTVAIRTVND